MTVLSIILGIIMVVCGFSLMCTPLITFLGAGYYIVALFFIFGVFGVIRGFSTKNFGLDFVFSILSLIFGIVGIAKPGAVLLTDFTLLYFAAAWFLFRGIVTFAAAIGADKEVLGGWRKALCIILGILEIALAIYSIAHPIILALTIGFLIGFYFIESGFNLIFVASAVSAVKEEVNNMINNETGSGAGNVVDGEVKNEERI